MSGSVLLVRSLLGILSPSVSALSLLMPSGSLTLKNKLYFLNFYLFLRKSGGGGREREGQRIQSGLCADSRQPDVGLELTNHEITT